MIEPKECQDMGDIRNAIDELDQNIIKLMSKRLEFVREASRFKKDERAVRDINRVREVVESKKKLAIEHNLPPELIGKIYEMMIDSFIEEELDQWNRREH
jgi:isochorismate pyruvate lyase